MKRMYHGELLGCLTTVFRKESNVSKNNIREYLNHLKSNCININDSVNVDIFLGAYNSRVKPNIYIGQPDTVLFDRNGGALNFKLGENVKSQMIGDYYLLDIKNGKGEFREIATKKGVNIIKGVIEVVSSKGIFYFPFEKSYFVN